jgi:hypothetical protein
LSERGEQEGLGGEGGGGQYGKNRSRLCTALLHAGTPTMERPPWRPRAGQQRGRCRHQRPGGWRRDNTSMEDARAPTDHPHPSGLPYNDLATASRQKASATAESSAAGLHASSTAFPKPKSGSGGGALLRATPRRSAEAAGPHRCRKGGHDTRVARSGRRRNPRMLVCLSGGSAGAWVGVQGVCTCDWLACMARGRRSHRAVLSGPLPGTATRAVLRGASVNAPAPAPGTSTQRITGPDQECPRRGPPVAGISDDGSTIHTPMQSSTTTTSGATGGCCGAGGGSTAAAAMGAAGGGGGTCVGLAGGTSASVLLAGPGASGLGKASSKG